MTLAVALQEPASARLDVGLNYAEHGGAEMMTFVGFMDQLESILLHFYHTKAAISVSFPVPWYIIPTLAYRGIDLATTVSPRTANQVSDPRYLPVSNDGKSESETEEQRSKRVVGQAQGDSAGN